MAREQPTDSELVRRALAARDMQARTAAFEAIADRHRPMVLRWCSRKLPTPEAAQDVGQNTFQAAFQKLAAGEPPEQPEKLAGWLIEIAQLRCLEYLRKNAPRQWAPLPLNQAFEDLVDDDEPRSGSAVRRAHALRLVRAVVATLTERQQQVYRLRFEQELTCREIAGRLGTTGKTASNEATQVQGLVAAGFGALILAQEGRPHCRDLARILDQAGFTGAGPGFTTALRKRIIRHFEDCAACDKCRICNEKRDQLLVPYVPVLIPTLFAAEFRERIAELIRQMAGQPPQTNSTPPPGSPPVGLSSWTEPNQPPPPAGPDRSAPARDNPWPRRAAGAFAALVTLGAVSAAAVLTLLPGPQKVPITITVITKEAAVSDIPGRPVACPDLQGIQTNCTKIVSVTKGEPHPIDVVLPPGSAFTWRYFGCDDHSRAGTPTCTITPSGSRSICITTTHPGDRASVAECRSRTA